MTRYSDSLPGNKAVSGSRKRKVQGKVSGLAPPFSFVVWTWPIILPLQSVDTTELSLNLNRYRDFLSEDCLFVWNILGFQNKVLRVLSPSFHPDAHKVGVKRSHEKTSGLHRLQPRPRPGSCASVGTLLCSRVKGGESWWRYWCPDRAHGACSDVAGKLNTCPPFRRWPNGPATSNRTSLLRYVLQAPSLPLFLKPKPPTCSAGPAAILLFGSRARSGKHGTGTGTGTVRGSWGKAVGRE